MILNWYYWYYAHYWIVCRYGLLLGIAFLLGMFARELVYMARKD